MEEHERYIRILLKLSPKSKFPFQENLLICFLYLCSVTRITLALNNILNFMLFLKQAETMENSHCELE